MKLGLWGEDNLWATEMGSPRGYSTSVYSMISSGSSEASE